MILAASRRSGQVPGGDEHLAGQLDRRRDAPDQLAVAVGLIEPPPRRLPAHTEDEQRAIREVAQRFADQPGAAAIGMDGKAAVEELDLGLGQLVGKEGVGGQYLHSLALRRGALLFVPIEPRPDLTELVGLAGRLEVPLKDLTGRSHPRLVGLLHDLLEQAPALGVANVQEVLAEHHAGAGVARISRQHGAEERFGRRGALDLRRLPGRFPESGNVLHGPGGVCHLQQLPAFQFGNRAAMPRPPAAQCPALPVSRQLALDGRQVCAHEALGRRRPDCGREADLSHVFVEDAQGRGPLAESRVGLVVAGRAVQAAVNPPRPILRGRRRLDGRAQAVHDIRGRFR